MCSQLVSSPAPRVSSESPREDDSVQLLAAARSSRLRSQPSPAPVVAEAAASLASGWSGILAAARAVSAWELPEAPRLRRVPDALWAAYAEWLLAVPAEPAAHTLDAIAAHLTRCIDDLADWLLRNSASAPVRAAADVYVRTALPAADRFPSSRQLAWQQARARILAHTLGRVSAARLTPSPRQGRPLRVGVLHTRLDHRSATFATLARCGQLDAARIDLRFFAFNETRSLLEERCRALGDVAFLPDSFASRLAALREARLDVLIFADDLVTHAYPVAQLAALRIAPLQISTASVTSGIATIDLVLSGDFDGPASRADCFGERLALLPATAQAWDVSPDRPASSEPWDRAGVGLRPGQACVVARADASLSSAALDRWQRLLAGNPDAVLLLIPEPGAASLDALRERLAGHPSVRLHEPAPANHAEFSSLLALGDLALDLAGAGGVLALEAGVPLLAVKDSPEAALLRTAGLDRLVFGHADLRDAELGRLLADADARKSVRRHVAEAMETLPRFADAYATAADFTALLETAWDELHRAGPRGFQRDRAPLRAAAESLDPAVLHAEGLALLAAGRSQRAALCLLSALQRAGRDPVLWFDLARAYHASGETQSAIESLEASLRLDEANAPGWVFLGELAADAGITDLARDALAVAAGIAPDHARLPALRARLAA